MSYTKMDERVAQRRLREIYNKKTRSERIKLAERFGYGGTDDSKLRVLRRVTAQVVPADRVVNLNKYYKAYTSSTDRNPWLGKYPDVVPGDTTAKNTEHGDKQLFHITASVMAVAEVSSGVIAYSRRLNTKGKIGETTDPAFSSDIRFLLEKFGRDAARKYLQPSEGGEVLPESGKLIFMAFTKAGAQDVVALANAAGFDIGVPTPEGGEYGIVLAPSTKRDMKAVRVYDYQRPLPKAKRDRIIAYTNRAKRHYNVT